MSVAAVGAMNVAVLVVVMIVIVIVVAIRAMNMGLLVHRGYSAIKSTRIIPQMVAKLYRSVFAGNSAVF